MRLVVAVEAASDALCRGAVVGTDISFESRTFRQSGQVVEDSTAAVVDEEDAQRTIELRVPKLLYLRCRARAKPAATESEPSMPLVPRLPKMGWGDATKKWLPQRTALLLPRKTAASVSK